ncbi:hypothetical protein LEP1GSC178_2017 [Leptospira licerasiae str. MMD4847]|uniref:ApeA N-terminal domain-containing protein n=2 Tax=Leptospira licerasiae TaxID=447106 RepID=A0ABN0HEG0_9LEPT|nr:hypothetical protein LEP1GSC178_2017 [Leptospira licerasiae str. MMD4847]
MSATDQKVRGEYFPLGFKESFYEPYLTAEIAQLILNKATNLNHSISKWKKLGTFRFEGKKLNGESISGETSFAKIEQILKGNREYLSNGTVIPELPITWMDSSIAIQLNFYAPENGSEKSLTIELNTKGSHNYPILPRIDREGMAFSSTLDTLEKILYNVKIDLVKNSNLMLVGSNNYWLEKLITYLNTSVSLIENMLIMLYYKAKHDHSTFGWQFDEQKLGQTYSRRLTDKISWVYTITGKHLPDLTEELKALNELKAVRNHLNHFDPPVFACTIEDVADWLNRSYYIARLALKVRQTVNSSVSGNLIKLLLSKPVLYSPNDPGKVRYKQTATGYKSCFVGE